MKAEYLIGWKRGIYSFYIKIYVICHFTYEIISGNFPAKGFIRFLRRLSFFLSKMKENKYVIIDGKTKINLYVPAFPTAAFFKACRKMDVTIDNMPCISVLMSVTSACRYRCEHCYQKYDLGRDVDIELLCDIAKRLDKSGVSFFNIEGGEPFLVFARLRQVCNSIENAEIWINSTGDGITSDKLSELKRLGVKGVMFSLHSDNENELNQFLGRKDAWMMLVEGISLCHKAGLDVAANTCLMKDDFYNGKFERILEIAKNKGISIIQLIKPKPSGGWLDKGLTFDNKDLEEIERKVTEYNNDKKYREYPFIAAQIIDEKQDMFGCTAGGTDRFYINAKGDVQPCEFLNISYGNIREEDFDEIFKRMRSTFKKSGSNWICESCSQIIGKIRSDHNLKTLPLSKDLSNEVINSWDRGSEADFYKNVKRI